MIDPLSNPTKDNTEQRVQYPKVKQKIHEMVKPHGGMILFSIDTRTDRPTINDVKEAKFEHSTIPFKADSKNPLPRTTGKLAKRVQLQVEHIQVRHKLIIDEHHYYVWAINKKNALKRYFKEVFVR